MQLLKSLFTTLIAIAVVDANGGSLDFGSVYSIRPTLKTVVPKSSSTTTTNRHSAASSILSRLSSSHSASLHASSPSKSTSGTKKSTSTLKSTKSTKKVTTTKTTKKVVKTTIKSKKGAKRQAVPSSISLSTTSTSIQAGCATPASIQYGHRPSPNTPSQFLLDSMNTYNLSACGAYCDNTPGCLSINIYFERSPQYIIDKKNCTDSPAAAAVKCALYGSYVNSSHALNIGQYQSDFVVVISGSNSYNKNTPPASVSGFSAPVPLYGAIDQSAAPGSYLGYQFFPAYNPNTCASYCTNLTQTNKAAALAIGSATYSTCNYFNIFNLTLNGASQGMYCQAFTKSGVSNSASLTYLLQNKVNYNVTYSYGYSIISPENGTFNTCNNSGLTVMDSKNYFYTIGCGSSLQGIPISSTPGANFAACMTLCDAIPGCSGYSYVPGTCNFMNLNTTVTGPIVNATDNVAWKAVNYPWAALPSTLASVIATLTTSSGSIATVSTRYNGPNITVYVIKSTSTPSANIITVSATLDSGIASLPVTTLTSATNSPDTVTVLTIYPTPPNICGNAGVSYAVYSQSSSDPAYYKSVTPNAVNYIPMATNVTSTITNTVTATGSDGTTTSISTSVTTISTTLYTGAPFTPTGIAQKIRIYGSRGSYTPLYDVPSSDFRFIGVEHTFYLYAGRGTGYYTFNAGYADDFSRIYIGPKALSGWNATNFDVGYNWDIGPLTGSTDALVPAVTYWLTQGSYVPIRIIYVQSYGGAQLEFYAIAPDGSYMIQSTPSTNAGFISGQIITNPCNVSMGPAFGPWKQQT